jgi:predicted transcriptional regulator
MMEDTQSWKRIPIPQLLEVAKALSNELRLRILEALSEKPMSVTELTKLLGVAQPTVTISIQMLEAVGLVQSMQHLGRGKICTRTCNTIIFDLPTVLEENVEIKELSMPIGMFSDCSIKPSCGLVGKEGTIGNIDDPQSFYLPERAEAQLIWLSKDGYIEYRFPSGGDTGGALKSISVSAELCSEAWGYDEKWKSDITLSINGHTVGTWTSPGDFGETKGSLTPVWWHGVTQYGMLTEWTVDDTGSFINGERVSDVTLGRLQLNKNEPIVVRFAVRPDAENCGGMNVFGRQFGNHPQDIKLSFVR